MNNYLIDRETLGQFVDELIKKKTLPVHSVEELEKLREETIHALDDKIGMNIFTQMTKEQNAEFNQLLDKDASEEEYDAFFKKADIDLEKIMIDTMKTFANEFLEGGQNA